MLDGNMHVEGLGAAIRTLLLPWIDASFLADRAQIVANLTASPEERDPDGGANHTQQALPRCRTEM